VDRFDTPLAAGDLCQVCRTGAVFAQAGYGVDDLLGDQGASGVVAVATLPALPLIPRAPYPRCPVSLKMRHGQRHYLRCLKYVRQLASSVVSPIMRQVCKAPALSYQVSGAGASFR